MRKAGAVHKRVATQLGIGDRDLRHGPRCEALGAGHIRYRNRIFKLVRVSKRGTCGLSGQPVKRRAPAWVAVYRIRSEDGRIVVVNRHSEWHVLAPAAVRQLLEGIGRRIEAPPTQPAAPAPTAACAQ